MPKLHYRPDIDGLRALAVVAIIVHHFNERWLPSGFLGVDVFFVISGFVISGSIAGRAQQPLGTFLGDFYRRRIQRLIPALVVCVAVTALLICLVNPDPRTSLLTGLFALFGVSNLYLREVATDYFGSAAQLNAFTQTWALGVEEQAYLLYPIIAWLIGMHSGTRRGLRRLTVALTLIGGLSLLSFAILSVTDPVAAYLLTPTRLWELAAGGLLFLLLQRERTSSGAGPRRFAPELALATLLVVPFAPRSYLLASTLITVLATATLIACLQKGSRIHALLIDRRLVHLGLISYSLFLWHWSVLVISRWTIGIHPWTVPLQILAMVVLAEWSFRHVETPWRLRSWAQGSGPTILRGLAIRGAGALVLGVLSLDGRGAALYAGDRPATLNEQRKQQKVEGTAIDAGDCLIRDQGELDRDSFEQQIQQCSSASGAGGRRSRPRLFVVGDSHATSLLPLENRLHALGHAITHISMSGCPFPGSGFGHTSANCTRFQTYGRDLILAQGRPQDVVIVAGYHLAHLTAGSRGARDGLLDADGTVIRDADHKLSLFTDSLNDFAAAARLRGMRVVLIGAGPRLFDRETCLAEWFRPEGLTDHCAEPFREQLEQARSLNEELAKRLHPSLAFFDPLAVLCGANCSPESMRSLLFDDDHLSADAVLRFKPGLQQLLTSQRRASESRP